MRITNGISDLIVLTTLQVQNNFRCDETEVKLLEEYIPRSICEVETCFAGISNKYYKDDSGETLFDPLHSGQYTIFLYYLSRCIWRETQNKALASKIYYLNKTLNACDLYYEVDLPSTWFVEHPVGTVMGRASYADYFIFQQNCTVGGNKDKYPKFGQYVWLYANAVVVGDSSIGNNVFVAAGTYIKDTDIPDNSIVFGRSPDLSVISKEEDYFFERSPFSAHH